MNIWLRNAEVVTVVAPCTNLVQSPIHLEYDHPFLNVKPVRSLNFQNFNHIISSILKLPVIIWKIMREMRKADHIHLRCPGNMGLLGAFLQIFFPFTHKTAKYAGNWDPLSKQPVSYMIQKWILQNTFLTRNMKVLVYGEWPNQSRNIKSFFTASYFESDKKIIPKRDLNTTIKFLFVGSLSEGKRPLYALQILEELHLRGKDVKLDVFGEGEEKDTLLRYAQANGIESFVTFHGNQNEMTLKLAYQNSHFLILASVSEGWPKAVAEAMFWGCVPISTSVSCVDYMLGNGQRGILLSTILKMDVENIEDCFSDEVLYNQKSDNGMEWSRQFTFDLFHNEISKICRK